MATYKQIQGYVREKYGFVPQTCWIAHAKELSGLPVKPSHNRSGERVKPCPEEKLDSILKAFLHFGMIK